MQNELDKIPEMSDLGKKSEYDPHYNPNKLFPIPRKVKRDEIGVPDMLPFLGCDIWNHYEVSWLTKKGMPVVAMAKITYDCKSPNIIESKSMKLYFNSFNNTKFENVAAVQEIIKKDLTANVGTEVSVELTPLSEIKSYDIAVNFKGINIDEADIECSDYTINPLLLKIESEEKVAEALCSDLLKSNCLVTNQPDWGSVYIAYKGKKINRESLLQYIVSFRNHNEFHEQCIERIFMDIMTHCQPEELTVYGRYTRRGGLDINPYRTTQLDKTNPVNIRLVRQ